MPFNPFPFGLYSKTNKVFFAVQGKKKNCAKVSRNTKKISNKAESEAYKRRKRQTDGELNQGREEVDRWRTRLKKEEEGTETVNPKTCRRKN